MSDAQVVTQDNRIFLKGKLQFRTVPDIQVRLKTLLPSKKAWVIDLSQVQFSDSSGLALLLDCQRLALKLKSSLEVVNMPEQMQRIAEVTGANSIIAVE